MSYSGLVIPLQQNRLLWSLISANMNVDTDQALTKAFSFTNHIISQIIATNASISLSLAVGGLYTTTSKGGTAIVAAGQAYAGLTGSTVTLPLTLASTAIRTNTVMYLSLTVAQGSPATADLYVYGYALT